MSPYPSDKNRVLNKNYKSSNNFYKSDLMLQYFLKRKLSDKGFQAITNKLQYIGKTAAVEMDELSLQADQQGPVLKKRNAWGVTVDQIEFHPDYHRLVEIAVECGMFTVKWAPSWKEKFPHELHQLSFAISSIYALSETGVYCPLCMTDGVAVLIDQYCEEEDKKRLLPAIYTSDFSEIKTGAMYLTEKAGGSDVGANIVVAEKVEGKTYELTGEKWFCSNANGSIAFALARTNPEKTGTKGLSIFLVEKENQDGSKNPMDIIRLKEKLGVRSMASAEIMLTKTKGTLVGEEFEGFKIMTSMINLSRMYNSVAALSASKRALIEAYQFLTGRNTFGKNALEHPLIRRKLLELGALNTANFYLVWRAIEAMDKSTQESEEGEKEKNLLRLLTPMVKKWSAEKGVYITRESMELMGGMGYIEDQVMPKLMRDIMVLPIWEGAGNIMLLDMLRASAKSKGLSILFDEVLSVTEDKEYGEWLKNELQKLKQYSSEFFKMDNEEMQYNTPTFFNRLTTLFQMSIMIKECDETSKAWILPTLDFLKNQIDGKDLSMEKVASKNEIEGLLAWEIE